MGDFGSLTVLAVIVLLAVIVAFSSLRIANEYERGVVFRLGRLIPLKGPGLFFIIPFGIDRLVKMDLRVITLEVPPQEIITNDNVTAKVNAVIYFQVVDARRAVTQVLNYTTRPAGRPDDPRRPGRHPSTAAGEPGTDRQNHRRSSTLTSPGHQFAWSDQDRAAQHRPRAMANRPRPS